MSRGGRGRARRSARGSQGAVRSDDRGVLRPRFVPHLEPMVRKDARVDEVWEEFSATIQLGAVRDSTFYTWRFLEAPSHKEPSYVILDRGKPIGACSLELMHKGATCGSSI